MLECFSFVDNSLQHLLSVFISIYLVRIFDRFNLYGFLFLYCTKIKTDSAQFHSDSCGGRIAVNSPVFLIKIISNLIKNLVVLKSIINFKNIPDVIPLTYQMVK